MTTFPIYLFIFIVFLNRYVFGFYITLIRRKKLDEKIEAWVKELRAGAEIRYNP